jgi:hypothetical protein
VSGREQLTVPRGRIDDDDHEGDEPALTHVAVQEPVEPTQRRAQFLTSRHDRSGISAADRHQQRGADAVPADIRHDHGDAVVR